LVAGKTGLAEEASFSAPGGKPSKARLTRRPLGQKSESNALSGQKNDGPLLRGTARTSFQPPRAFTGRVTTDKVTAGMPRHVCGAGQEQTPNHQALSQPDPAHRGSSRVGGEARSEA